MNIGFRGASVSHPARIAGWAAATLVVAGTAVSGAQATTTISFNGASTGGPNDAPLLISLAGSTSPLYSISWVNSNVTTTQTVTGKYNCDKFGQNCQTGSRLISKTNIQRVGSINSLTPDAQLGNFGTIGDYHDVLDNPNFHFSTTPLTTSIYDRLIEHNTPSWYVPTNRPDIIEFPLANRFLPIKFTVKGQDYIGAVKFINGSGIDYIEYDAVPGAVPEPDSWAMMIAGLGLTGMALRRRRRRAALTA